MPAETKATHEPEGLNRAQQRRLTVTCEYIDKLLSDMENVLHSAASQSPFPRYIVDLSPARARVVEDYIRRLRTQLLQALAWQHMKPKPPDIPATHAVTTQLSFIDIAIEELKPTYMRGYGTVPEDAVAELNGVVHELRSLVESMERYVRQEPGIDLESRLRRLEETGCDVALLQLIEHIVTHLGLVEFRARIDLLASRLEDNNLEVALFGRVSSGKSSLLNALLNTDILPVGVNPITAVPTKLRYGPALRGTVTYGNGSSENVTIEALGKLITEQGNPGNLRNVASAIAEIPSPRLRQGIVLVDTPGLGSLAKRGSAETLAYLPSCDLALLLIDAGTTLNEEDIGTLRLLYEAGIPAIILLSKADLLTKDDTDRAVLYIQEHLQHELGLEMGVRPVSSLPDHLTLLDDFFMRDLLPRFDRARGLRNNSSARKIGALRESVITALETILEQKRRRRLDLPTDADEMEEQLRVITGEVGEQRTLLAQSFQQLGERPQSVLDAVENYALTWMQTHHTNRIPALQVSEWLHSVVQDSVEGSLEGVRSVLQRAIETLQTVAQRLDRSDRPTQNEMEIFFRGVPRFELVMNPNEVSMNGWTLLGESIVRSRIRKGLQQSVGVPLQQELRQYAASLSLWSREFMNKVEMLLGSYANAYRTQLQRLTGVAKEITDIPELKRNLELLNNWDAEGSRAVRRIG